MLLPRENRVFLKVQMIQVDDCVDSVALMNPSIDHKTRINDSQSPRKHTTSKHFRQSFEKILYKSAGKYVVDKSVTWLEQQHNEVEKMRLGLAEKPI